MCIILLAIKNYRNKAQKNLKKKMKCKVRDDVPTKRT